MTKKDRKAIFIDIDKTLMPSEKLGVSAYDIEQLMLAKAQGHRIFLNTGRSFAFIPVELRHVAYIDGIIAGGGAHVILEGKTIHHRTIAEDQLCAISELYLQFGKWCQFEGETDNYRVFDNGTCYPVTSAEDFRGRYKGAKITKITMEGEVSPQERALLHPWFYLYKMPGYSEGIIRGESKTGGIERILEATGMSWENTIGIGDSANDIEMIINVAFGVAMKNAVTELKQAANVVTDDCWHSGVGKAIAQYVLK